MNEKLTIADSKRAFHKAFPYVIPPIYRRVADELLVELHLLGHQKNFKLNGLFAIGLTKVFETFTQGYRPNEHLTPLFESLCKCNGLDPTTIKAQSNNALNFAKNYSLEIIVKYLNGDKAVIPEDIELSLNLDEKSDIYYSRLTCIGIYTFLSTSCSDKKESEETILEATKNIGNRLGFSSSRVEKDLNQYKTNVNKLTQAIELIQEAVKREKSKSEQSKQVSDTLITATE